MSLQNELGLLNPIENKAHEALLNIVLTATLLAKEGNRLLRPLNLTDSQFNVLMLLRHQTGEGGELNQTRIGEMLLVNRSNVTGLIDRMEQAGFVERAAHPEDRRINNVRLTPKGRDLLERAEEIYRTLIKEVIGALPKDDRTNLCRILERVRENLRTVERLEQATD